MPGQLRTHKGLTNRGEGPSNVKLQRVEMLHLDAGFNQPFNVELAQHYEKNN